MVCRTWAVAVDLVVLSKNGFIAKMCQQGIAWSEGLLLGPHLVGSYSEEYQPE